MATDCRPNPVTELIKLSLGSPLSGVTIGFPHDETALVYRSILVLNVFLSSAHVVNVTLVLIKVPPSWVVYSFICSKAVLIALLAGINAVNAVKEAFRVSFQFKLLPESKNLTLKGREEGIEFNNSGKLLDWAGDGNCSILIDE